MTNPYLIHFVEAQDALRNTVVEELSAGRNRTHWMRFAFPQLEQQAIVIRRGRVKKKRHDRNLRSSGEPRTCTLPILCLRLNIKPTICDP
jgi:hypothetical protein